MAMIPMLDFCFKKLNAIIYVKVWEMINKQKLFSREESVKLFELSFYLIYSAFVLVPLYKLKQLHVGFISFFLL